MNDIELCPKSLCFVFGVDNAAKISQMIFHRDNVLRGKKIIVYKIYELIVVG